MRERGWGPGYTSRYQPTTSPVGGVDHETSDSPDRSKWIFRPRKQYRLINLRDNCLYHERWILFRCPMFQVLLHHFGGPDAPVLHDHPWVFTSFVVRGRGYNEVRRDPRSMEDTVKRRRFFNRVRLHEAHYVHSLIDGETWTLLFTGRIRRKWGFWYREPLAPGQWRWVRHDLADNGVRKVVEERP